LLQDQYIDQTLSRSHPMTSINQYPIQTPLNDTILDQLVKAAKPAWETVCATFTPLQVNPDEVLAKAARREAARRAADSLLR
jgi:hypothetical protein